MLQLLAEGKSMKEVAAVLDISPTDRRIPQIPDHGASRRQDQRRARAVRDQTRSDNAAHVTYGHARAGTSQEPVLHIPMKIALGWFDSVFLARSARP